MDCNGRGVGTWRVVLMIGAVCALPWRAAAQEAAPVPPGTPVPAGDHDREWRGRHGSLFIAPCGRPYRGQPGEPYPVAAWFAQANLNHDGRLTMREMRDDAARFFAELDVNHDGELDPDEVNRYEIVNAPEVQTGDFGGGFGGRSGPHHGGGGGGHHGGGHRGGRGESGGSGSDPAGDDGGSEVASAPRGAGVDSPRGAARFALLGAPEPVAAADTEITRFITLGEFLAKADRDFHALDFNDRGYLTLADLPKTPAQSQAGGLLHKAEHARHSHGD